MDTSWEYGGGKIRIYTNELVYANNMIGYGGEPQLIRLQKKTTHGGIGWLKGPLWGPRKPIPQQTVEILNN